MAQLAIDITSGDIALGPGGLFLVDGLEAIRQSLWMRLMTIRGELPYATNVGIPMFEEITVRGTSPERAMQVYRGVILGTPGINGFIIEPRPTFDAENSFLAFDFVADTDFGQLSFSGTIPVVAG